MSARTGTAAPDGDPPEPGVRVADPDVSAAAEVLSAASDVTLLAHVTPDADALGSALALGMALHRKGATVRVAFSSPNEVPVSLADLDSEGLVVAAGEVPAVPETLVVLDTGSLQRVGSLADRVAATADAGGHVVVIDHHVSNTRFGTRHVIDESAEATAMIVLRLLDELGAPVDLPVARCLYAGIVTDTRSFRNASPETHRVAVRLLEAGVDPDAVTRRLMDTHPFGWLGMLSTVLGSARLETGAAHGLGFVHAAVGLEESDGLGTEELDSVVEVVRTTAEAEVTAVLKEMSPAHWTVSLRSDSRIDVGWVAEACGGGGHRLAAGFTADGPPEDVVAAIRDALGRAPLID